LLWTGEWSAGTLKVPGVSGYRMLGIHVSDVSYIVTRYGPTKWQALMIVWPSDSAQLYMQGAEIAASGDTLTYPTAKAIRHMSGAAHFTMESPNFGNVRAIYGIF
jgi:hypothetical protein